MTRLKNVFLRVLSVMKETVQDLVNDGAVYHRGDYYNLRDILTNGKLRRELALLIVHKVRRPWKSITTPLSKSRGHLYHLSGEEWITRLEDKGFILGDYEKKCLRSDTFLKRGGSVYDLVVIKSEELEENRRHKIIEIAESRGYLTPPTEVALVLRESITNREIEEAGFRGLAVMHEPFSFPGVFAPASLLCIGRENGGLWAVTCNMEMDLRLLRGYGFVFLAPRT